MGTPEITTALAFFDRLLAAIGLIRAKQKEKSEKADQALYALYAALNETNAYVSYLQKGKSQDKKRELAIAKLWQDASVPLRKVDHELAERCFDKGSYWLDSASWTEIKIHKKRIGLTQMLESVRELLMEAP